MGEKAGKQFDPDAEHDAAYVMDFFHHVAEHLTKRGGIVTFGLDDGSCFIWMDRATTAAYNKKQADRKKK